MQLILFFLTLLLTNIAGASSCRLEDLTADDCSFYNDCVEERIQCGQNGYALGYGEYYCKRFNQTFTRYAHEFSSEAHHWREMTAVCLQKEISSTVENIVNRPSASKKSDCLNLKKSAFSQHAGCYTQEESSICFLPPDDVLAILRFKVIQFKDLLLSRDGRNQIIAVQRICLQQLKNTPNDRRFHWWQDQAINPLNYL